MWLFSKKKTSSEEIQDWYKDRYTSISIQRNFLLLFSVFASFSLLICLIIVQRLQENKANDPYLIEYDKKSGYMTIVETKSKKEYTAQQAVKESMILQYINKREAPFLATLEEDINYVRVTTAAKIYSDYLSDIGTSIRELKSAGMNPKYEIQVKSLQYLAANRVQVTIAKNIVVDGKQMSSTNYNIVISFGFVDIEMPIDDMRINPLGFQISYYRKNEIKTFKSIVPNSNEHSENNNGQSQEQQENSKVDE